MINKKGFTLVEILSVIVLIALLLGVGIPGINRISKNMKEKSLNTKIDLIEEAAVLWGQDNKALLQKEECTYKDENNNDITTSCYKISIDKLIKEDYLDSEDRNEIKFDNPTNGDTMLGDAIYIYKKNNRVHAFYSKEVLIEIVADDDIKSGNWHSGDFKLTILGSGKITYSWNNENYDNEYTTPIDVTESTESTTLYAKIESGAKISKLSYEIKLDKGAPEILNYTISYDTSNSLATLHATARDDLNITQYKFDTTCDGGGWKNINNKTIDVDFPFNNISNQNKDYYFCIKDSRNPDIVSSSLFVANCKITSSFRCTQEETSYLFFWTKWKSSFQFYTTSNNTKKLYIVYDIEDDLQSLLSSPATFKHELNENTTTVNSNVRKDYKDGCDSEDDGIPTTVYLDSGYNNKCYETRIYKN